MPQRKIIIATISTALASATTLFGYEFIRSASKSMFIDAFGSANMTWGMAGVPPTVFLLIFIYGKLLSRFGAERSLQISSIFSIAFIGFAVLLSKIFGSRIAIAALYLFTKAYIVILISQYWSFINSTLTPKFAKSFNGPFIAIASIGAIFGGLIASKIATTVGTETLPLFTAVALIPGTIFSTIAYRIGGEPKSEKTESRSGSTSGFLMLFRSHYLFLLFAMIFLTQVLATAFELRFYNLIELEISDKDLMTEYFSKFYMNVNAVAFVLQFVVTPILLRFISIRVIQTSVPIVHLISAIASIFMPSLRMAALAMLLFKSIDYSIFGATKEILYMPLSFDARYRAKQAIDSLGYRSAEGITGGTLGLIGLIVKIVPTIYPKIAVIVAIIWIAVAADLTKMHRQISKTDLSYFA